VAVKEGHVGPAVVMDAHARIPVVAGDGGVADGGLGEMRAFSAAA